ncbi:MAG: PP2C family protein-serine/threonine phosphatase [Candidatus Omnitrophica bacterium]|nr:PP2C family protein-serine/threonine phosphatase [Candidatus Omnitrophota bacterium]MDD5310508.1 PP2C family protein-serine/threonine phosphatase [Candidatus Omnitrophota bacterium]MDD5546066.1 PP2C family protein-serine/threonine phosphatase [Candidatus Omnitrophota bacterium]
MAGAIIPDRLREEYRGELKNIFAQRVNLFCYIALSAFTIEVVVAWFLFRRLLSTRDMPGILGGAFFSLVLLTTGKFAKRLTAQKIRGFFFSIIIISISILAAAAHPDVITNLGITLVLIAFFVSALLLPWNMIETGMLGAYTLIIFMGVYSMSNIRINYVDYVHTDIFGINVTLLIVASFVCMVVKRNEGIMRQKDFVLKKEIEEKSRIMVEELELANRIHSGLMPKSIKTSLVDVAVDYRPMLYMGGDYAKFHFLDKNRLLFMIADMTGHGVSAALLVNRIHTEIEGLVRDNLLPGEILKKLDNFIKSDFGKIGIFLSAFCGVIDFSDKKLVYSNYGHPPQILFQKADKKIVLMESQTFLMGIGMETSDVYQVKINFERGDRIFLFTDGLIEAKNKAGEEFGYARFEQFVRGKGALDVAAFNEDLLAEVGRYQEGAQADDIFLLSIQIK